MAELIRSIQQTLAKAKQRFLEIIVIADKDTIHRDAFVQRFEFTFELYWKTLQKILKYEGVLVDGGPRSVLKAGESHGYVNDIASMIDFLEARNRFSHVYDEESIEELTEDISENYTVLIEHIDVLLAYVPANG